MKQLSVSDFKQRCLELLDSESLSIEPLALTRHNKVVAIVTEPSSFFSESPLRGSVKYSLADGESLESIQFADQWSLANDT